jgi:hypothetical protein
MRGPDQRLPPWKCTSGQHTVPKAPKTQSRVRSLEPVLLEEPSTLTAKCQFPYLQIGAPKPAARGRHPPGPLSMQLCPRSPHVHPPEVPNLQFFSGSWGP